MKNVSIDKFEKAVRTMRVVLITCLVIAPIFLGFGLQSLTSESPLLDEGAGIAFTVIGGLCALAVIYLFFFSVVIPAMMKMQPEINKRMLEANRENIRILGETIKESKETAKCFVENEDEMFCKRCGKKIPADSVYCKHCGEKQI
ncbi:MAG: zinc ribbon domain-containing protein [Christensenellales bacterium]